MAVYSVSEVSRYLTEILREDPVLQNVWVRGEVGNLTRSAAGHSYFSLRDADATLRCVMFRGGGVGADLVEEGSAVIAHGRVALYEPRGDLQLIADVVQSEGVGELQLKLEELKVRLEKEGLFEESRKRPLPRFPVRVGVVTSPTGSVWHDIQNVTARRYPAVELVLAPALVQGNEAVSTIVAALDALERLDDIDVVIVARGGGSLEDLWPFNEEDVARAIFKSGVPVVSAIGHETDYTIADLVADVRAPTPSAAAELVMPDQAELLADIGVLRRTVSSIITGRLETAQWEVGSASSPSPARAAGLRHAQAAHRRHDADDSRPPAGDDASRGRARQWVARQTGISQPARYPVERIRHRPQGNHRGDLAVAGRGRRYDRGDGRGGRLQGPSDGRRSAACVQTTEEIEEINAE